ncbi:MAG: sulfatase-like hydrolase/transferase, partial [Alphaproteobacteria bacterium]|nr:sulfatase-like hydrolase/transferase [Alphaproteobacteria bacterium]
MTGTSPGLNLLFITADQWRGDTLGCAGHPVAATPHLDRLAADGVLFARHYSVTSPCGPARASLLTGRYAMTHRSVTNGTPLDARFTNLALELRKAGYDPALIGYTDTTIDPRTVPPDDPRLFTYEGVMPGFAPALVVPEDPAPWTAWLAERGYPPGLCYETVYRPPAAPAGQGGRGPTFAPALYRAEDSDTAFVTGRALDWLKAAGDGPWALHLSLLRPHPPWIAPAPWHALYDPADVPTPRRAPTPEAEAATHPLLAFLLRTIPWSDFCLVGEGAAAARSEADVRQARATYYGLMTEVDHHLGRVFAWLRESGQWDRTLIVVTSDHGEQAGDHHLFGKKGWFDASFHIPLIVRDPRPDADAGRGGRIAAFTESVDVMPTILDRLGCPIPHTCDGEPLTPFLRGERPTAWRDAAHWEFDFRDVRTLAAETALGLTPDQCALAVLRGERFKYVHFTALPPLFYDLAEDPEEMTDRAADPGSRAA